MNIVYRKLDESCVQNVYYIECHTFSDAYSLDTIADCATSKLYNNSLVAEVDGKTAAYILATNVAGEAEILRIAVAQELRKCGVGDAILTQFRNECTKNNIGCIHLEVRQSNIAAISLYIKHGFKQVGVRRAYYSDNGEDAVLYTLIIDGR